MAEIVKNLSCLKDEREKTELFSVRVGMRQAFGIFSSVFNIRMDEVVEELDRIVKKRSSLRANKLHNFGM